MAATAGPPCPPRPPRPACPPFPRPGPPLPPPRPWPKPSARYTLTSGCRSGHLLRKCPTFPQLWHARRSPPLPIAAKAGRPWPQGQFLGWPRPAGADRAWCCCLRSWNSRCGSISAAIICTGDMETSEACMNIYLLSTSSRCCTNSSAGRSAPSAFRRLRHVMHCWTFSPMGLPFCAADVSFW